MTQMIQIIQFIQVSFRTSSASFDTELEFLEVTKIFMIMRLYLWMGTWSPNRRSLHPSEQPDGE